MSFMGFSSTPSSSTLSLSSLPLSKRPSRMPHRYLKSLGLIVRLYKGKPRDRNESYRPITLLNCDYNLVALLCAWAARPVTSCLSPRRPLSPAATSPTTCSSTSRRWTDLRRLPDPGGRQGCLAFLDFKKAYDRMDRAWMHRCLEHYGFCTGCCLWIAALFSGTCTHVLYTCFCRRLFDVMSSVAQGRPISPPCL